MKDKTEKDLFKIKYEELRKLKSDKIMECVIIPSFKEKDVRWFMEETRKETLAEVGKELKGIYYHIVNCLDDEPKKFALSDLESVRDELKELLEKLGIGGTN